MTGRTIEYVFPPRDRGPPDAAGAVLEVDGPGPARRVRRRLVQRPRRRDRRPRRAGRLRPVGDPRDHLRRAPADRRHGHRGRASGCGRARCRRRSGPGSGWRPEERKSQGLLLDEPVYRNVTSRRLGRFARVGFLDRRRRAAAAAEVAERARRAPGRRRAGRSARCPAATSRRSCWPAGCCGTAGCCCSTSRPAASTSAPAPSSTGWSARWPTAASACCWSPARSRRCSAWPTGCWSCATAGSSTRDRRPRLDEHRVLDLVMEGSVGMTRGRRRASSGAARRRAGPGRAGGARPPSPSRLRGAARRGAQPRPGRRAGRSCAIVGVVTADGQFARPGATSSTILRQASIIGVVTVGMTFVIIGGGIDLSVGAIVALAVGLGDHAWRPSRYGAGRSWSSARSLVGAGRRAGQRGAHRLRPDGAVHRDAGDAGRRPRAGRDRSPTGDPDRHGRRASTTSPTTRRARHPAAGLHLRRGGRGRLGAAQPHHLRPAHVRRRRQPRGGPARRHRRPPAHRRCSTCSSGLCCGIAAIMIMARDHHRLQHPRRPLRAGRDRRGRSSAARCSPAAAARIDRLGPRRAGLHHDHQPVHPQQPADRGPEHRQGRHHRRRRAAPAARSAAPPTPAVPAGQRAAGDRRTSRSAAIPSCLDQPCPHRGPDAPTKERCMSDLAPQDSTGGGSSPSAGWWAPAPCWPPAPATTPAPRPTTTARPRSATTTTPRPAQRSPSASRRPRPTTAGSPRSPRTPRTQAAAVLRRRRSSRSRRTNDVTRQIAAVETLINDEGRRAS